MFDHQVLVEMNCSYGIGVGLIIVSLQGPVEAKEFIISIVRKFIHR